MPATSLQAVLRLPRRTLEAQTHPFEIARGSAAETLTVLQRVDLQGGEVQQHNLRRIDRMLQKLGG